MSMSVNAPRHRFSWLLMTGLALCSIGAATRIGGGAAPSGLLSWWRGLDEPHRFVQADDQGTLIKESDWNGTRRSYHIWKDADGRSEETYEENGAARPVDANVKLWAQSVLHDSRHLPPVPPMSELEQASQEILPSVQDDPRLVAMLGAPIVAASKPKGSISTWERGEPHLRALFPLSGGAQTEFWISLSGPRGDALLHAKGEREAAQWSLSELTAQPSQGGVVLNLLTH